MINKGDDNFMGVNYFSDEQVALLKDNPYIEKITNKSIKYSIKFKEEFWKRYSQGELPSAIVQSFGIDPKILGNSHLSNIVQRIKMEADRLESFEDTRRKNNGRPKTKNLTYEERIAYLEYKVAYQKQEIEFLKKIRSVEKKALWKQQKKNIK